MSTKQHSDTSRDGGSRAKPLRTALVVGVVICAAIVLFYGVLNNPFRVQGYYGVNDSYLHLKDNHMRAIEKDDKGEFFVMVSESIDLSRTDYPGYSHRLTIVDYPATYIVKSSPLRLTMLRVSVASVSTAPSSEPSDGLAPVGVPSDAERIFNPITIIRLAWAEWNE